MFLVLYSFMKNSKDMINKRENKRFFKTLKEELYETGRIYLEVAKRPYLLGVGFYNVCKDILYELPKSFIQKAETEDIEKRLKENASQALTLSELVTIPGTYAGIGLFKALGSDDYSASVIGGAIGNYISGALSYLGFYTLLTRGSKGYSIRSSFTDGYKVVKDCFPAALTLYFADAPLISGMIAAGLNRNLAVGTMLLVDMTIFMGLVKYSSSQKIDARQEF